MWEFQIVTPSPTDPQWVLQVSRFKCTPLKINSPVNLQQPAVLQSDSPSHCIMTPQSFRNNWFALQSDSPFCIDS